MQLMGVEMNCFTIIACEASWVILRLLTPPLGGLRECISPMSVPFCFAGNGKAESGDNAGEEVHVQQLVRADYMRHGMCRKVGKEWKANFLPCQPSM